MKWLRHNWLALIGISLAILFFVISSIQSSNIDDRVTNIDNAKMNKGDVFGMVMTALRDYYDPTSSSVVVTATPDYP